MASSFTGDLVGRVLGSRYRLRSLIGNGASARVYLADDVKLRRRVAVKVLHASLAEDDAFLLRFQREAEALAPLSHPNIVVVHDVNHGINALGEPPYLVTEYLAGGSLLNVLDVGYRLSLSQAAIVGLEAARGLQFAHARNLVHRDIKPANLLFGDDQRVRIADFGLARALADFGRTEPSGSPVGTTRYLSPEQARGSPLDGRSDIYSLALVLIESVTGSVPFTADTWQGMAMARNNATLEPPEEMGILGPVLEQAGALDPAQRLDAVRLVEALEAVARNLPRGDRLPLDGSMILERGALLVDRDPTEHVSSTAGRPAYAGAAGGASNGGVFDAAVFDVALHEPENPTDAGGGPGPKPGVIDLRPTAVLFDEPLEDDLPEVVSRSTRSGESAASTSVPSPTAEVAGNETARAASTTAGPASVAGNAKPPKSKRRKAIVALVAVVAVIGALFAFVQSRRVPSHPVPSLANQTVASARSELALLDLEVRSGGSDFSATVSSGRIISQAPPPGQKLKEGEAVVVRVSKGVEPVEVPALSGLTLEGARALIADRGLTISNPPTFSASETVPEGLVIDWSPKGKQPPRTLVRVVMSSGLPTVLVPKVAGQSPDSAVAVLTALGLVAVRSEAYSNVTAKGNVAFTTPKSATEVKKGSTVTVFVSRGPELVRVPNVVGMSPADATAVLRAAGLTVSSTVGTPDAPVEYTRPRRTTSVKRNSAIVLYTNIPPADVAATTTTAAAPVTSVVP